MEILEQKWTKPSAALRTCVALVLAGVMGTVANSAKATEDDYMFCSSSPIRGNITYYSAIFLGDYSRVTRAKLDFHGYLEDAGKNPNFLHTLCFFENTYEEAERELERRVRRYDRYPFSEVGWTVVHTNWRPGYSAPQPSGESDDSHGRESGGDGCYFGECPDGVNPAPQSPDTPIPSRQTSQRTLICQTPDGWCEMSTELPIGVPCGCLTLSGPIGGITVPSRP